MNLAIFTDWNNVKVLKQILQKYYGEINVLFVLELPAADEHYNQFYFYNNQYDKEYKFLREYHIDCAVVYGWSHKIPAYILTEIPFYNIHPSILPKYRGPIPIIFQLLNGEKNQV